MARCALDHLLHFAAALLGTPATRSSLLRIQFRKMTESAMGTSIRPLAIVTGASAGIDYEFAKQCAQHGYDLVIAADEPAIEPAAQDFRGMGARVDAVEA